MRFMIASEHIEKNPIHIHIGQETTVSKQTTATCNQNDIWPYVLHLPPSDTNEIKWWPQMS